MTAVGSRLTQVPSCLRWLQHRLIGELCRLRLGGARAAADDQALRIGQCGGDLGHDGLGEDADLTIDAHLRATGGWAEEDTLVGLRFVELQP